MARSQRLLEPEHVLSARVGHARRRGREGPADVGVGGRCLPDAGPGREPGRVRAPPGGSPRRAPPHPGQRDRADTPDPDRSRGVEPRLVADGALLAFEAGGTVGSFEIAVLRPNGKARRRLTRNGVDDVDPTWSPGGDRIAFTRYVGGGNADIHMIEADGTGLDRLTSAAAAEQSPAWSSRGWIAFARSSGERGEIRVVQPDGTGGRRVGNRGGRSRHPSGRRTARASPTSAGTGTTPRSGSSRSTAPSGGG